MSRNRKEFPRAVKAKAFLRADGKCEVCTARLQVGKFDYDHIIPDALGGEPILSNCSVCCEACHDEKSAKVDVPRIAKMKRQRDRHIGAMTSAGPQIVSRGFAKAPPQRRASSPLAKTCNRFERPETPNV